MAAVRIVNDRLPRAGLPGAGVVEADRPSLPPSSLSRILMTARPASKPGWDGRPRTVGDIRSSSTASLSTIPVTAAASGLPKPV